MFIYFFVAYLMIHSTAENNLSQHSQFLGRDLNLGPPGYNAGLQHLG
jgi:hypothetical protein